MGRLTHMDPIARSLFALLFCLPACSEDMINQGRADTGIAPLDGSQSEPLQLEVGMMFSYRAILTFRDSLAATERNSSYTMNLRIATVDDQRGNGDSALTFVASEPTTTNDDWADVQDFDSWVGRLGPSLTNDTLPATAVTEMLSSPPEIPPAPNPSKLLPSPGTFFLDLRAIAALRSAFADKYAGRLPQVVSPEQNNGKWRFSFSGRDALVYYGDRSDTRSIELEYDPRGFLTRLDERLGDASSPPAATCRIELLDGP